MSDLVFFNDLRVKTSVGVSAEERSRPQTVRISVEVATDLVAAGGSDALADTVDYHGLIKAVATTIEEGEFALLERLAEEVARLAFRFKGAGRVTVKVIKEDPPVAQDVGEVGVTIVRERQKEK
jgi:7,8-dihydroneopterin aldolase/epimerase/oxygenase